MSNKAFIFDLDGVIVDTAKYHYLAWRNLANSLGFDFTEEQNEHLKGVSRVKSLEILLEIGNINIGKFLRNSKSDQCPYCILSSECLFICQWIVPVNYCNCRVEITGNVTPPIKPDDLIQGSCLKSAEPYYGYFLVALKVPLGWISITSLMDSSSDSTNSTLKPSKALNENLCLPVGSNSYSG